MLPPRVRLPVEMLAQPDETTCGPTCLHAVNRYWGRQEPLVQVIARAGKLERGGTVAVFLACDALRQGYQATIYTFNLMVFDPSWFVGDVDIAQRLLLQQAAKPHDSRVQEVTAGYDRPARTVLVSDPYGPHPYGPERDYWLDIDRAIGAILLGIVTHDANLLLIRPRSRAAP